MRKNSTAGSYASTMNKQKISFIILIVAIYILLKACWLLAPKIFTTADLQAQDTMLRIAYETGLLQQINPDIVYIDIDDKSLGRLPYSPDNPLLYSKIISTLHQAGVARQILDLFFNTDKPEPDLTKIIAESGNTYLPLILRPAENTNAEVSDTLQSSLTWQIPADGILFPQGKPNYELNQLHHSAKGVGHINCWPDIDGVISPYPVVFSTQQTAHPRPCPSGSRRLPANRQRKDHHHG